MTSTAAATRIGRASPRRERTAPLLVIGVPFSGATTLARALGEHPELEPVVGEAETTAFVAALGVVENDLLPLLRAAGGLQAGFTLARRSVVSGPELAKRVGPARLLFPGTRVIHVHRPLEEVVPHLLATADLSPDAAEAVWRRLAAECVAAESDVAAGSALRIDYADLVRRPKQTLRRCLAHVGLDEHPACLWPLRLLTTDPRATGRRAAPPPARAHAPRPRDATTFCRRLRTLVEAVTFPGASILVATRGDDELTRFRGRTGAHFPQLPDGTWAGFYPADDDAAVAHLHELTAAGATHVLFPQPALWWLDHYRGLRTRLEQSARLVACDLELGVVWELPEAQRLTLPATLRPTPRTPREPENGSAFTREGARAPRRRPQALGGSLWAVTTFYNPARYRTKKANYDRFRAGLAAAGVPLLTVELAFGDEPFELRPDAADRVVQLRGGDVLWQKERLLNLGLEHLPDDCDAVAWLDADVLFARADWARETRRQLRDHVVVQPFSHCVRLPRGAERCEPATLPFGGGEGQLFYGIAWGVHAKGLDGLAHYTRHGHTGFAWAARRTLLETHGLYEANLLGNADTDIAHAMFGNSDYWGLAKLGDRGRAHVRRWAKPFAADVDGSVAFVDGVVTHLWHGSTEHRLYDRRLDVLHGFDPDRDLVRDESGLLAFSADAPAELRAWARDYFASRREDGA